MCKSEHQTHLIQNNPLFNLITCHLSNQDNHTDQTHRYNMQFIKYLLAEWRIHGYSI